VLLSDSGDVEHHFAGGAPAVDQLQSFGGLLEGNWAPTTGLTWPAAISPESAVATSATYWRFDTA